MSTPKPPKDRCHAVLPINGKRCKRVAAPNAPYCPTHQFLTDAAASGGDYASAIDPDLWPALRSAGHISLVDELELTRLQIRQMAESRAPNTQILNALRTLAILVRLEERFERQRRRVLRLEDYVR